MTYESAPPRRPALLRRSLVAGATLLALAVTGCANAEPGVVAYVGDDEITQTELDRSVTALSSTLQDGQTVSSEAVVNALIQGSLAEQIAADQGIAITDADRERVLQGTALAPLVDVPDAKQLAYDVADGAIVAEKVGAEPYLAEVERREVTLNPRFGVLDPVQKVIVTDQSGSLSVPAAPAPETP
jgi:hypothetical protein